MSLGSRIQEFRRTNALTIKDVAIMVGVTPSLISQIENDKANPSISTLSAIADALNINIRSLFEDDPAETDVSPVVRANRRMLIASVSGWERFCLSTVDPKKFCGYHITMTGDAFSGDFPEMHSPGDKGYEFGYVLSGKLQVKLEDKIYILNPGDSISFDTSKTHFIKNGYAGETTLLWCMSLEQSGCAAQK